MSPVIAGLVLAGGKSSRFGREKALADVGGRPIIAHVAGVLAQGCSLVAINARADSLAAAFAAEQNLSCLADQDGDPDGPLSGVKAGLVWAKSNGADFLATAPCDTPFLPFELVATLLANTNTGLNAVTAKTSEGLQPLCTLWPVSWVEPLTAVLKDGDHPAIRDVLTKLGSTTVFFRDASTFDNLNTEWDYNAALIRQHRPPNLDPV